MTPETIEDVVHAAAVAGLDPEQAWDRTPGELVEYISAYRDRRRETAILLYDLAGTIANMIFGKRRLRPAEAFPGFIREELTVMTGEQILANCLAWCDAWSGKEEADGRGTAE